MIIEFNNMEVTDDLDKDTFSDVMKALFGLNKREDGGN